MKRKLLLYTTLLSFLTFGVFFSCQKKEEKPAEKTVTSEQVDQAKGIKQDEPPRSQKKFGEFESNGTTVAPPATYNNAQNTGTQEKLQILSSSSSPAGGRMISTGIGGWNVKTVNGQTLASDFLVFFDVDGTYMYFDYETGDWDWGYYYINKALTLIVFDPGTQWEDAWTISTLTNSTFTIKNDNSDVIVFENYLLDGYEEEEYTETDATNFLKSKKWYISFYDLGEFDCSYIDPNVYVEFYSGGIGSTFENDTLSSNWKWSVNNGKMLITESDTTETYNIDYYYNGQFGLSYYEPSEQYTFQFNLMTWDQYSVIYKSEIESNNNGGCTSSNNTCEECNINSDCYDKELCDYNTYGCVVCDANSPYYNYLACYYYCPQ